jgi:acetyl-CoA synthetase
VFERGDAATYDALRAGFRWDLPERFNLGVACADEQAATSLAMIEVVDGDVREHTFGDVAERSNRFANGLASLGIGRGDRVGIMLPQGLDVAVAHLAVYKLGAVAVPLTQLFGPDAVRHRLGDSAARAVVTDTTSLDLVAEVARDLAPDLEVVVAADTVTAPHRRMQDLIGAGSARLSAADTGPDDPGLLIYTSGTTGSPKGALHGHRVLYGHLPGFELMFDHFPQGDDRMWTPADWAWIGGLLDAWLPAWFHGRPIVATPKTRFDPAWAIDLLRTHRVTATFLPPTALKLMRHAAVTGGGDLHLRTVMSGGEPLGGEMLAWGEQHLGVTINEIYGQTEANLLVGNSAAVWEVRAGSMGLPYPGHDVAILAPHVYS